MADDWKQLRESLKKAGVSDKEIERAVKAAQKSLRSKKGWGSLEEARQAVGVAGAAVVDRIEGGDFETKDANAAGYLGVAFANLDSAIRKRDMESAPDDESSRRADARDLDSEELARRTHEW